MEHPTLQQWDLIALDNLKVILKEASLLVKTVETDLAMEI
jgi:hypothetical protein